jgi:hypothetical protein
MISSSYLICWLGTQGSRTHGFCVRLTLTITWPQSVFSEANGQTVAAQVNGDVKSPLIAGISRQNFNLLTPKSLKRLVLKLR